MNITSALEIDEEKIIDWVELVSSGPGTRPLQGMLVRWTNRPVLYTGCITICPKRRSRFLKKKKIKKLLKLQSLKIKKVLTVLLIYRVFKFKTRARFKFSDISSFNIQDV